MDAWRIELVTPRTIMESYKVLRVGAARDRAAPRRPVHQHAHGARRSPALGLFDRSKAPGPDDCGDHRPDQGLQCQDRSDAGLLLDGDRGQRPQDPGQRRPRLCARATGRHGAGPVHAAASQALQEYPEQAQPYAQIHALLEAPPPRYTVQMWPGWATRRRSGRRRGAAWTPT